MPKLAECDPRAVKVVLDEIERMIGPERFDSIAMSNASAFKQYGQFMYHAGQRAMLDKLRSAFRKQDGQ